MRNTKAGEEAFDAVLRGAFADSFQKELDRYEANSKNYADAVPSDAQKKAARREYKRVTKKRSGVLSVLRRIAAVIVVVLGAGAVLMLAAPEVRAAVRDTVVTFFDRFADFRFSEKSEPVELGEHALYYLPEGYVLTSQKEMSFYSFYTFSNGTDEIYLRCMLSDFSTIALDTENHTVQEAEIPGYTAYTQTADVPGNENTVVWGDEEHAFVLSGMLPVKELLKMARGLLW